LRATGMAELHDHVTGRRVDLDLSRTGGPLKTSLEKPKRISHPGVLIY
jgi:hypothetical protein